MTCRDGGTSDYGDRSLGGSQSGYKPSTFVDKCLVPTDQSALHWSVDCGEGKRNGVAESRAGSGQDCELRNLGGDHSTRCLRSIHRPVGSFELSGANRVGGMDAGLRVDLQRALGASRYARRHSALARSATALLDSPLRERIPHLHFAANLLDAFWNLQIKSHSKRNSLQTACRMLRIRV